MTAAGRDARGRAGLARVLAGTLPPLAALAVLCGAAAPLPAAARPSLAECESRDNATPALLAECLRPDWTFRHLTNFQAIADANPDADGHGNRDAGTPGYFASAHYVARLLRHAGYTVTLQPYSFSYQAASSASLRLGGVALAQGRDFAAAIGTGAGHVRAALQRPGRADGGSAATGCAAGDYAGFVRGRIALLPDSGCTVADKVELAARAGAAAVIVYRAQDGNSPGGARPAVLRETAAIPVLAYVSAATGARLLAAARNVAAGDAASAATSAGMVELILATQTVTVKDANVIADSTTGDAGHIVVVDAHLDSIFGPGILDNASGSASALEIALKLSHTTLRNKMRYAFFGGEELGLHGSRYYTRHLSADALRAIAFDIDVDVTATPNYDVLIASAAHSPLRTRFPPNVVPASALGDQAFAAAFQAAGLTARPAWFGNGGTDSINFALVGVPNTGVLTQQDCCKTAKEVKIWGGVTGNYEGKIPSRDGGCVDRPNRWCDDIHNVNRFVLGFVTAATGQVVLSLGNHDFTAATR